MTMTFATETNFSFAGGAFSALIGGLRTLHARRAQRLAVAALLEMDPSRLDDLGVNALDIREALSAPLPTGSRLAARRNARAMSWTPRAVSAA
jgi:uncharacterized protein YjiS (DUF1127 family)